jgi:S1-C subfamily serine protease
MVFFLFALQGPARAEVSVYALPTIQSLTSPLSPPGVKNFALEGAKLEIARIRSGLLPGVVIGGHYGGILKMRQQRYTASGELDERLEDAARRLIEDELRQAGYDLTNSLVSSVFEEQWENESEPSRFLLGGTITRVSFNSYSSLWGDRTLDERTIRWEVFDRELGKVVYRRETTGQAEAEGIENPAAIYEAIRASFRVLLDEPNFIAALKQPLPTVSIFSPATYEIPAIASSSQSLTVEQIAGRSIPSIAWIRTPAGRGSGFLLDSSGLMITNQHVVGSAFSVKVDLYDGSTKMGRVLKRDEVADLALVKLEAGVANIPGLPMCQTNAIKVGESVIAIGNPLALSNTVTQGVVSGFRTVASRNLIQTDAAVNPGNSGGPLLNRYGEVIGIVTEKISSRGVEGLGFALPIGESLQRLNVRVHTPVHSALNPCGNPIVSKYGDRINLAD